MPTLNELVDTGKRHCVTITNREGEPLLELSLLWAVIISLAAPHALLLVVVLALLELIRVELDGKQLDLGQQEED